MSIKRYTLEPGRDYMEIDPEGWWCRYRDAEERDNEARRLINAAADIMTAEQIAKWEGVRGWLEDGTGENQAELFAEVKRPAPPMPEG